MDASTGRLHASLLIFFPIRGLRSRLPLILAPNVSAGSEELFTGAATCSFWEKSSAYQTACELPTQCRSAFS